MLYQYIKLTRENDDYEYTMLFKNKLCRTVAPSSYTNILHVVN